MLKGTRLLTHILLAALTAAGCVVTYFAYPRMKLARVLTLACGDVALILLVLTIILGPLYLLRQRRNPLNIYLRRDIGIWTAITGGVHVWFGLQVYENGVIADYFFGAPYRLAQGLFGRSNQIGAVATLLLVILLILSNDIALRLLKGRLWKFLQRFNYILFVLIIAHTLGYQVVVKREFVFIFGVLILALLSFALQVMGFLLYVLRRPAVPRAVTAIVLMLLLTASGVDAAAPAAITLDPRATFQTITGWEAVAQAGQASPAFPNYRAALFDQAVGDLGINRLRVEVRSGAENTRDYWSDFRAGRSSEQTWRAARYATVNDNADPFNLNPNGFHFSELDNTVEMVVLPFRQRVQARGEKLFINVNYVAFTAQIGAGLHYDHYNPEEYAEFVLAAYQHLQSKYGLVPDAWEVVLEPDNARWSGAQLGQALAAAGKRLQANGFTPRFIAPSTANLSSAVAYFDAIAQTPDALSFLAEISYHRYSGVSEKGLQALGDRAAQHGVNSAMLEHIGADYQELHQDLKIGRVSAWQQYTLAFPEPQDSGGKYYLIDDGNPSQPKISMGSRTRFLRQYFKFIRSGAVRIGANSTSGDFDPLAFIGKDGKYVVVVKAGAGGAFVVQGLPAGEYGIKYTTASQYDIDLPAIALSAGQALNANIPAAGVLTLYGQVAITITPTPAITPSPTHVVTPSAPKPPTPYPTLAPASATPTETATPSPSVTPAALETPTQYPTLAPASGTGVLPNPAGDLLFPLLAAAALGALGVGLYLLWRRKAGGV